MTGHVDTNIPLVAATIISEPTNGAKQHIEMQIPYAIRATIYGTTDILFHRYNVEAVEEAANAPKGSEIKKKDILENYVWRNDDGIICVPGEYIRMSIVEAAKYKRDPRSPRKSAAELYEAAISTNSILCPLINVAGELPKIWDYEHKCRAKVQMNAIPRTRPAFKKGYMFEVELLCSLPEYITPDFLYEVLANAGKLSGIGDFRPSYGKFRIEHYAVLTDI